MKEEIVLVGGGGHCKSVIDVIEAENRFKIVGIVDPNSNSDLGYPNLGNDEVIPDLVSKYQYFHITIGAVKSRFLRKKLFEKIKKLGGDFPVIISPNAYISPKSTIGKGSIVMHNALINSGVVVGENNIINTGSIIEHDCLVGHHNHISTKVVLNGSVKVGDENLIGGGSIVIEGKELESNITLGAGSLVTKNIIESGVYFGSPAVKK